MSTLNTKYFEETIPQDENDATYERMVLGYMIKDEQTIPRGLMILSDEYFKYEIHRDMFRVIRVIWNEDKKLGLVKMLELMGADAETKLYMTNVSANLPYTTIDDFKDYCRLVLDAYRARTAARILENSGIYSPGTGNETDKIQSAVEQLSALISNRENTGFEHIYDIVTDYWNTDINGGGQPGRIETGIPKLDKILDGIYPEDLVIIGAQTGVGKTAFVLQLAQNMAKSGKKVLLYSLEMSQKQNMQRVLANLSSIHMSDIKNVSFENEQLRRLHSASEKTKNMNLYIKSAGGIKISDIRLDLMALNDADVIIVDHIGLLNAERRTTRYQDMTQIAIDLKALATQVKKPIIALSQLSRAANDVSANIFKAKKEPNEPQLYNLRDSGEIEQSASTVILLWQLKGYEYNQKIGVKIAKNRQGGLGKFALKFKPEVMQYENVEHDFDADDRANTENVI